MRWILRGIGGLLALGVLAVLALIVIDRASLPKAPDRAALIATGERYDVRIRRDEWGVPHILGKTDADAAFGLAYAQSEDDFATVQSVTLATRGTLARAKGRPRRRSPTTWFRCWTSGRRSTAIDKLPADLRAARGLCRRGQSLRRHPPGGRDAGPAAADRQGHLAGFVFKQPFFYGLDGELKRLNAPGRPPPPPKGSNGLALAPRAPPTTCPACWSIRTSPIPARSPGTRPWSRAATAGTWPAASSPARRSCCTATTPPGLGQHRLQARPVRRLSS
jgi:acyl-homoserine-lactone acylase